MKNYNTALTDKEQKYEHYHLEKFIYIYIYINKYLTDEEILPTNQRLIIEQAKFACYPLGKAFAKQTKTIDNQGI